MSACVSVFQTYQEILTFCHIALISLFKDRDTGFFFTQPFESKLQTL